MDKAQARVAILIAKSWKFKNQYSELEFFKEKQKYHGWSIC